MPILAILLLAILVASFGFWDTLAAILGATGVLILLVLLAVGALVAGGASLYQRTKKRLPRR